MSKINDGGPAFPRPDDRDPVTGQGWREGSDGMTLRDWFAGQALAGMMANETTPFSSDHAECEPSQIAAAVYEIADAMLQQREAS
jgi:hypothetical protein